MRGRVADHLTAGLRHGCTRWPDGERGDRFWSDRDVHAEALTRLVH